jgi:ParB-like nuclease domain
MICRENSSEDSGELMAAHEHVSKNQFRWTLKQQYAPEDITHYNKPAPTDADVSWLQKTYGQDTKFVYDELPRDRISFGGGDRMVDDDPEQEERYIHSMIKSVRHLPPVLVGPEEGGKHAVWDGGHRMEAHDRVGSKTIPVIRPVEG